MTVCIAASSVRVGALVVVAYIICHAGLPAQQNAMVEAVSKSAIQLPEEFVKAMNLDPFALLHKGAVAYEDTARAEPDSAWDGAAATERLRQWAGIQSASDLDLPTRSKYARGFAYVAGDGTRLDDYK